MQAFRLILTGVLACFGVQTALGAVSALIEHHANENSSSTFKFKEIASPSRKDAATKASFRVVDGERDDNAGQVSVLHDGQVPSEDDVPEANFFFAAGSAGGRLVIEFEAPIDVKRVNTYSWHPNTRGPQVYKLYGSEGSAANFASKPAKESDPTKSGWKLITEVDTRSKAGAAGGQYAVSIFNPEGSLGKFKYLLFAISRTEADDAFGNTFYSEIDVIDANAAEQGETADEKVAGAVESVVTPEGYEITVDTSETPDLTQWAREKILPMAKEWYPKIIEMLPSANYEAPKRVNILFSERMEGVAATSGTRVRCAARWFRRNLEGEAVGAVFHELVHVVQQYGRARRANPDAPRTPGWLTEGIPDYLRWFIYEPQTKGAEITRRNISRARYDASYRISANFLNWVTGKYSKELVKSLNAAIREGKYNEELWKELTGHTLTELGDEWKKEVEAKVAAEPASGN